METTNKNDLAQAVKATEKWWSHTNSAMMELWNKQLEVALGYYDNLNSAPANGWYGNRKPATWFSGANMSGWPWGAFNSEQEDSALSPINTIKQMLKFNRNFFGMFNTPEMDGVEQWGLLNKHYRENLEKRIEAFQRVWQSLIDAGKQQADRSLETSKTLAASINEQIEELLEEDQKIWNDMLKLYGEPRKDEKLKEQGPVENKKKSATPVVS